MLASFCLEFGGENFVPRARGYHDHRVGPADQMDPDSPQEQQDLGRDALAGRDFRPWEKQRALEVGTRPDGNEMQAVIRHRQSEGAKRLAGVFQSHPDPSNRLIHR